MRAPLFLAISIAGILSIGSVAGSTWTVNTTDDHSIGFCTSSDCTLREALTIAANGDIIEFAPSVTGTITLGGAGELFIQANITINGPGANVLSINGANATRVFEIKAGSTVSISGLTITSGFVDTATPGFGEAMGGGILNNGTLYLTACELTTNNVSFSGRSLGGGLHNQNGSTAVIRGCTFDFNGAEGSEAWGAGMSSRSASVIVINSTFSNNVLKPLAPLNSGQGGGVFTLAATVTLLNCTIAVNLPSGNGTTSGGGIARTNGGAVFVENTIIVGNSANQGPDAFGSFSSLGHNLVGNSSGSTSWVSSDKLDASAAPANLGGLVYNGGPTKTHAITIGSVAIDAGDDSVKDPGADGVFGTADDVPLTTDQRGFSRPVGAHLDIGAYELRGIAVNVSTRLPVGINENVLIEGFIVQGPPGSTKKIIVRALGPSLASFGIGDALANPTLEIHDATSLVAMNNDWKVTQPGGLIVGDQSVEIAASGVAPPNDLESAIIANLAPGSYTAVVKGAGGGTGTGVVDAFDLSTGSAARLANIATRGLVQPGDKLMIAGFIVQNGPVRAVVTGIGPSLTGFGVNNALPDTTLQLRDVNGALVAENDDWKIRSSDGTSQQVELEATGLQPANDREAAFVVQLSPGQYTAQLRAKPETTGVGLVQVYFLP